VSFYCRIYIQNNRIIFHLKRSPL